VVSAETVNCFKTRCFKTRLDRFWLNQDIIYNFRSVIHGTGLPEAEVKLQSNLH